MGWLCLREGLGAYRHAQQPDRRTECDRSGGGLTVTILEWAIAANVPSEPRG